MVPGTKPEQIPKIYFSPNQIQITALFYCVNFNFFKTLQNSFCVIKFMYKNAKMYNLPIEDFLHLSSSKSVVFKSNY